MSDRCAIRLINLVPEVTKLPITFGVLASYQFNTEATTYKIRSWYVAVIFMHIQL